MLYCYFSKLGYTVYTAVSYTHLDVYKRQLGRLLTAGALMGAQCKNESDVLTLQIQCNGPIGGRTVTADAQSRVKGYVNNPNVILHSNDKGKLDVAKALDLGVLSVIKDIGLKEPYVGQTQLVSGEIAEDRRHDSDGTSSESCNIIY